MNLVQRVEDRRYFVEYQNSDVGSYRWKKNCYNDWQIVNQKWENWVASLREELY